MDWIKNNIINQFGSPSINENITANRPPAGQAGRLFVDTQALNIQRDNGVGWDIVSGGGGGGGFLPLTAGIANPLTGDLFLDHKGIFQLGDNAFNSFASPLSVSNLFSVIPAIINDGNSGIISSHFYYQFQPTAVNNAPRERATILSEFLFTPQVSNYSNLINTIETAAFSRVVFDNNNPAFSNSSAATFSGLSTQLSVNFNAIYNSYPSFIGLHVLTPILNGYVSGFVSNYTAILIEDNLATGLQYGDSSIGILQKGVNDSNFFYGKMYFNNTIRVSEDAEFFKNVTLHGGGGLLLNVDLTSIFYQPVTINNSLHVSGVISGDVTIQLSNTGTSFTQWRAAAPIDASGRISVIDVGAVAGVWATYRNDNARVGFIGDSETGMNYVAEIGQHNFNAQVNISGDIHAVNEVLSGVITQNNPAGVNFLNAQLQLGVGQTVSAHISAIAGSIVLKVNGTDYYLAYMNPPV